jgi:hypothetical protein
MYLSQTFQHHVDSVTVARQNAAEHAGSLPLDIILLVLPEAGSSYQLLLHLTMLNASRCTAQSNPPKSHHDAAANLACLAPAPFSPL